MIGNPKAHRLPVVRNVRLVGVIFFFSAIKLTRHICSSGIDLQRAWILSKMKTAATVALPNPPRLSFFQAQVLDLARACDKLAAASQADSNFHRMRVLELWSLLPCFCQSPSDIDTSLGPLATTLGRAITDKRYPELVVSGRSRMRLWFARDRVVKLTRDFIRRLSVEEYLLWRRR